MRIRGENKEYYKEKRLEYILEKEKTESKLRQEISFGELIKEFKFESIIIPENAVCAEYFAYYNFNTNRFMTRVSNEETYEESYSYFVFILGQDRTRTKILDMSSILLDETVEKEMNCFLDATEDFWGYGETELEKIFKIGRAHV